MKLGLLGVAALSALLVFPLAAARAQEGDGGGMRGQFAGMQRVTGEITASADGKLTVKEEDGAVYTVVTTDNTRFSKRTGEGRGADSMTPIKLADVKAGDGVFAMGVMDAPNKTLHAVMVFTTDASVVKALKANMGKTYIVGKVTAVDLDNAKMTVTRPDGITQVIAFDENTSFRRGHAGRGMGMMNGGGGNAPAAAPSGESITLADVKVGDQVAGQGAVKDGSFVPTQLTVSTPRPKPANAAK